MKNVILLVLLLSGCTLFDNAYNGSDMAASALAGLFIGVLIASAILARFFGHREEVESELARNSSYSEKIWMTWRRGNVNTLTKIISERYNEYRERAREYRNRYSYYAPLLDNVEHALERGNLDAARLGLEELKDKADSLFREAATMVGIADVAKRQPCAYSYRLAAKDYGRAAALVRPLDVKLARKYEFKEAQTLQDLGFEFGDEQARSQAVQLLRRYANDIERQSEPAAWAKARMSLGYGLQLQAERDESEEALQEAVTVYREALSERPRERFPEAWAATMNNLGVVLRLQGDQQQNLPRWLEAREVLQMACDARCGTRAKIERATSLNHLALVNLRIGERLNDNAELLLATSRMRSALQLFKEALDFRHDVPLKWAQAQHNLGTILVCRSKREDSKELLLEAIEAFHTALRLRTRERLPLDWAITQVALAEALYLTEDPQQINAAHLACENALPVYQRYMPGRVGEVKVGFR